MIYFEDKELVIRTMTLADGEEITKEEIAQGWNADVEKYQSRIRDEESAAGSWMWRSSLQRNIMIPYI